MQKTTLFSILPTGLCVLMLLMSIVSAPQVAIAQNETLQELNAKGNQAFGQRDYVSALYYFNRIRESDQWESYPDKISVLSKLAMVEESQSRFREAAHWYRQLIEVFEEQREDAAQPIIQPTYRYYSIRYADCLERSGAYAEASRLLWSLVPNADPGTRVAVFERLIRNYSFQTVDQSTIDALRAQMGPDGFRSLGFDLADLYRTQGYPQASLNLYETLIQDNPSAARDHVSGMIDAFEATEGVGPLLRLVRSMRNAEPGVDALVMLEVRLLEGLDRSPEALEVLEEYLLQQGDGTSVLQAITARNLSSLVDVYISLVLRERGSDAAIDIVETLVERDPIDVRKREQFSELLANAGRVDEAVQTWMQWAEAMGNPPNARLLAAEQIFALGADGEAAALVQSIDTIQPESAVRKGITSLRLGQYGQAFAAFNIASASSNVGDSYIVNEISTFTQTAPNVSAIFDAMVQEASGKPYTEVPQWIRDSVEELGFRHHFTRDLNNLARSEPSGVWRIQMAREAVSHGKSEWALNLIRSVPEDSPYQVTAQTEKAFILRQAEEVYKRREAARLLQQSMAPLVSATSSVKLSPLILNRLMEYAEVQLLAYQPEEALRAVVRIENATDELTHPLLPRDRDRLQYLRSQTLMQLASWQPALDGFRSVQSQPWSTEALWYQARILLAQQKDGEATVLLQQLVEDPQHWQRANDALRLLNSLEPLVGESLDLFCRAQIFLLQGRYDAAIPVLRNLAVEEYGEDGEEWARYTIGMLELNDGDLQDAREEWTRLLLEVDHPVIHGMIRLQSLDPEVAGDTVIDMTGYQQLLNQFPNSLFADLARLDMQRYQESATP